MVAVGLSVVADRWRRTARKLCIFVCTVIIFAGFAPARGLTFTGDLPTQPQSLDYAGLYSLKNLAPWLNGQGVDIALICRSLTYIDGWPNNDYRPDIHHSCLQAANMSFYDQAGSDQPPSAHSTAIASILFGSDPNAWQEDLGGFYYRGIAPQAGAKVYEFWNFLAESTGRVIVAGIGNGTSAFDPVLYPAANANTIGVGVVRSVDSPNLSAALAEFAFALPENSSCGPTQDGRCKPDIVAAGNCLAADANNPSGYQATGDWSSFSAPVVAGTAALLMQHAKQNPDLSRAVNGPGTNCLIKAILLSSAKKLAFWHKGALTAEDDHLVPLDYAQGAGTLDAVAAYRLLDAGRARPRDVSLIGWDKNYVTPKAERLYRIEIAPARKGFITATLVWNRHYADSYPFDATPALDSDLRLELWAIDGTDTNNQYLLDYSDSFVDNIEHIYFPADPNYTQYEIVVSFSDPAASADTDKQELYALAWNLLEPADADSIYWYDLNADGTVDALDLTIMVENFTRSAETQSLPGSVASDYPLGDINNDGSIDMKDLEILAANIKRTADWYQPGPGEE